MKIKTLINKTIFILLLSIVSCEEDYSNLPDPKITVKIETGPLSKDAPLRVDIDYVSLSGITHYCYGFYQSNECLRCVRQNLENPKPEITTGDLVQIASDTTVVECNFVLESRGGKNLYKTIYVFPDGHIEEKN